MNIKNTIKLFSPPLLYFIRSIILGLKGRIALYRVNAVKYNSKQGKSIFVIGNGPSLKTTVESALDILKNNECMVVNLFVNTEYFSLIKPSSYLVVDPVFAVNPENLSLDIREKVCNFYEALKEKVKWHMFLYLPVNAKDIKNVDSLSKNPYIEVVYFNNWGKMIELLPKMYFWALNRNLAAPLGMTVLNTCISLAITMRYSDIYLVGADTSWHENYWMDQDNNDLYAIDKHFYGINKVRLYKDVEHQQPSKIHDELTYVSTAFKSYVILSNYADYNNVKVYNASAYSWIDAFERKHL